MGVVGVKSRIVAKVPCYGIEKGAVEVSETWMDHKIRLFVDKNYVVVLVDDVNRDVLRDDVEVGFWEVEDDGDYVVRFDAVAAFDRGAVDEDMA